MSGTSVVELFAGFNPEGSHVVERLPVQDQEDGTFVLVRSPAFVKGIAKGDKIKLNKEDQSFEVVQRSGNLCIRVLARHDIERLAEDLMAPIEKMGGELDFQNDRILVFSVHVSCGFALIEALLNDHIGEATHSTWFYGNVYDPLDGVRPLNWWTEILKPQ